jgi:hypothetical protein
MRGRSSQIRWTESVRTGRDHERPERFLEAALSASAPHPDAFSPG